MSRHNQLCLSLLCADLLDGFEEGEEEEGEEEEEEEEEEGQSEEQEWEGRSGKLANRAVTRNVHVVDQCVLTA